MRNGIRTARIRELSPGETHLAYRAMTELRAGRPTVASEETFVRWIDGVERPEGYRLVGVFEPDVSDAVAVAGFRTYHTTAWGQAMYVDDLVTLPGYRSRGHADALFDWLVAEARRLDCDQLHLDSGVHRFPAHRFYLKHGMEITCHHFGLRLEE